jgi:hypothetical protein
MGGFSSYCQDDLKVIVKDSDTIGKKMDPLRPAKATFYAALVPGLGQIYNKKYWKAPIAIGAIATGVGIYIWNNDIYKGYRNAYKQRILVGEANATDEYVGILRTERLIDAQKQFQRQRDLSLLITVGLYVLTIIDANVDAHLKQFNVNEKLSLRPDIYKNDVTYTQNLGLSLNYSF